MTSKVKGESVSFMKKQIDEKLAQGFSCIKMKIGAIDFETELKLLKAPLLFKLLK